VSPSPSKERGKKKKEGLPPLLDSPGKTMDNRFSALAVIYLKTGRLRYGTDF